MRDQDFQSNDRQGIFSDTNSSPTDGFVYYGSVDLGPRLLEWKFKNNPGTVDFLVGFQFWRESWTARGLEDILPGGRDTNANAITETVTWKSIRLGPRIAVPMISRVTAVGQIFYIPWTQYQNDDIHHLRTDLGQDPSSRSKASGGSGVQFEGALQIRVWRALRLEAGYRYWDVRSGSGTIDFFDPFGGISTQPFNEAKARRQGIFFGLDWTF